MCKQLLTVRAWRASFSCGDWILWASRRVATCGLKGDDSFKKKSDFTILTADNSAALTQHPHCRGIKDTFSRRIVHNEHSVTNRIHVNSFWGNKVLPHPGQLHKLVTAKQFVEQLCVESRVFMKATVKNKETCTLIS